jgi:tetratricopeptide (TPR) repeat protein
MTEAEAREARKKADELRRAGSFAAAIPLYHSALGFFTEDGCPEDWAGTQNDLGNAYADLPTGDRAQNLANAVACYQAALRVRTEKDFPADWAMTQNDLGIAYRNLPTGGRAQNLANAIGCYQAALRVYTEKNFPADWAMTQYNLGNAYADLPAGDRAQNLARAIDCYQAVLRVYTEQDSPSDWAMTQNNLGVAFSDLPTGDRAQNLANAIACYQAALRVYTEKDFLADWAMIQNNLGSAYSRLPTGDRAENRANAIACYQAALRVYAEKDFPAEWAMTQYNLGNTYFDLPTGDRAENLSRAIACYQIALRVRTEKDFPAQWAMTQNNLGAAFSDLPTGDRAENLAKAVACYQAALRVYTEKDFPAQWATTQNNLAWLLATSPREALPAGLPDPWDLAAAVALTEDPASVHPDSIADSLRLVRDQALPRRRKAKGRALLRAAAAAWRGKGLTSLAEYAEGLAAELDPPPKKPSEVEGIWKAYSAAGRVSELTTHLASAQDAKKRLADLLASHRTVPDTAAGVFWVLRQWNSFTPLLASGSDVGRGGGYFLEWRGKGVVVDPGIDFLRNFREAGKAILDVDGIILTHNHLDHVGDVIPLLTLLHEYNELHPSEPHAISMALSPSTFSMFSDMAAHSKWISAFLPLRIGERTSLPEIPVSVEAFPAVHGELGGRNAAVGLRLLLHQADPAPDCVLVMPGDGGWTESLNEHCTGAGLLVLHLGGIYPADVGPEHFEKNHLGTKGVFALLWQLAERNQLPRLTLISELGEELSGRESFIADACCANLPLDYRRTLVESALNRGIALPYLKVICEEGMGLPGAARCLKPGDLCEWEERPGEVKHAYRCDDHTKPSMRIAAPPPPRPANPPQLAVAEPAPAARFQSSPSAKPSPSCPR